MSRLAGRPEEQSSSQPRSPLRVVRGVAFAVADDQFREIKRRHALQAGGVDAELQRVRATPVVGIDAADRAEMMLGDAGGIYLFVCTRCPARPFDYRFDCS